jgi:hypothetical protein
MTSIFRGGLPPLCGAVVILLAATSAGAQLLRPPLAEITPLVEVDGVDPSADARVAIQVRLPEGLHVNANEPRDPSLIPIVLTIDPPPGVTVAEIV